MDNQADTDSSMSVKRASKEKLAISRRETSSGTKEPNKRTSVERSARLSRPASSEREEEPLRLKKPDLFAQPTLLNTVERRLERPSMPSEKRRKISAAVS